MTKQIEATENIEKIFLPKMFFKFIYFSDYIVSNNNTII